MSGNRRESCQRESGLLIVLGSVRRHPRGSSDRSDSRWAPYTYGYIRSLLLRRSGRRWQASHRSRVAAFQRVATLSRSVGAPAGCTDLLGPPLA